MNDKHQIALEAAITCRKELQSAYTAILCSTSLVVEYDDAFKLRRQSQLLYSEGELGNTNHMSFKKVDNKSSLKQVFEETLLQVIEMQRHLVNREASLDTIDRINNHPMVVADNQKNTPSIIDSYNNNSEEETKKQIQNVKDSVIKVNYINENANTEEKNDARSIQGNNAGATSNTDNKSSSSIPKVDNNSNDKTDNTNTNVDNKKKEEEETTIDVANEPNSLQMAKKEIDKIFDKLNEENINQSSKGTEVEEDPVQIIDQAIEKKQKKKKKKKRKSSKLSLSQLSSKVKSINSMKKISRQNKAYRDSIKKVEKWNNTNEGEQDK